MFEINEATVGVGMEEYSWVRKCVHIKCFVVLTILRTNGVISRDVSKTLFPCTDGRRTQRRVHFGVFVPVNFNRVDVLCGRCRGAG